MTPVKCKVCGKTEWRHVCGGLQAIAELAERRVHEALAEPEAKAAIDALADKLFVQPTGTPLSAAPKPKTDRKAYLAQKARERRARQKVAKVDG